MSEPIYSTLSTKPDPAACGYEIWECKSLAAMGYGDSGYIAMRIEQNFPANCTSCPDGTWYWPNGQGVDCDFETGPAGNINYSNAYCS